MNKLTVGAYMTPAPETIGAEQTLARAHAIMRAHDIRHLPVLRGGALVGIVSQRDLHLIETLKGVSPDEVTVDEAMTPDPVTVRASAPLGRVAAEMAKDRHGSVVVVDGEGRITGVFTTTDALGALAKLARPRKPSRARKP